MQVLSGKLSSEEEEQVWLAACNASFATMIKDKQSREAEEAKATASLSPPFSDPPSWGPKLNLMASMNVQRLQEYAMLGACQRHAMLLSVVMVVSLPSSLPQRHAIYEGSCCKP